MCVNSVCKSEKNMWVRSQHLEIMTCEKNEVKLYSLSFAIYSVCWPVLDHKALRQHIL